MSITIKEMTVKHECATEPFMECVGIQDGEKLIWSDPMGRPSWLFCPWCAVPLPQDMAAVIKAVS